MAEREMIRKEKIEFTGLMDFSGVYGFVHSWFAQREYGVNEDK